MWVAIFSSFLAAAVPGVVLATESQHLFIIERSANANTVVYDLRLGADGTPPRKDPIDAYWKRYATSGKRMELRWLEKRLAYGVKMKSRVSPTGFDFHVRAFDERRISVRKVDGVYRATLEIDGAPAHLNKVYVSTGDKGLIPRVYFIELFGETLNGGHAAYEKIVSD